LIRAILLGPGIAPIYIDTGILHDLQARLRQFRSRILGIVLIDFLGGLVVAGLKISVQQYARSRVLKNCWRVGEGVIGVRSVIDILRQVIRLR
jgi:hypothetical protein